MKLAPSAGAAAAGSVDQHLDDIESDTASLNDTKIPNTLSLANINAEVDTALADYDAPTKAELDSGLAGLNDLTSQEVRDAMKLAPSAGAAAAGSIDEHADNIQGQTDLINFTAGNVHVHLKAQDDLGFQASQLTSLASEISDALTVDTIAELAAGAPAATPTIASALMLLYMWLVNDSQMTNSPSERTVRNSSGTIIAKATVSDASGVYSQGKLGAP